MKDNKKEAKKYPIQFMDFVLVENTMWYAASGFNGLFKADMKTMHSEFVGCFPHEEKYMPCLYSSVSRWNHKLIFSPYRASNIAVYDMHSKKFETYEIPEFDKKTEHPFEYKFASMAINDDDVFFIGNTYPIIMRFNMKTKQTDLFCEWYSDFKKYGLNQGTFFFDYHIVKKDNGCFYVTSRQNNVLMEYNMERNQARCIEIGDKSSKYSTLVYGKNAYWMIDANRNVLIKFIDSTGKVEEIVKLPGECGNYDLLFFQERLWIFSKRFSEYVVSYDMIYDLRTSQLKILDLKVSHGNHGVIFARLVGKYVYCMYPDVNYLYRLEYNDTLTIDKIEFKYDDLYDKLYALGNLDGNFYEENGDKLCNTHTRLWHNLETFLLYNHSSEFKNDTEKAGDIIWQAIKWEE